MPRLGADAGRRAAVPDPAGRSWTPPAAAGGDLTDDEVDDALARHPRIGERPAPAQPGREAGWSRSEQGGVDAGDAVLAMALRAGNAEYEKRFGRVFLIRAAGRSGAGDPGGAQRPAAARLHPGARRSSAGS